MRVKFICVLKSGGDYDWEYVEKLYEGVKNHCNYNFKFICYSDFKIPDTLQKEIMVKKLRMNLPGSWSKIECFNEAYGINIYLDLDTIITGCLDMLVMNIRTMSDYTGNHNLHMLKAFKKGEEWASGIMGWSGSWSWLISRLPASYENKYGRWDQRYIKDSLRNRNIEIKSINAGTQIVSYKRHCQDGVPEGTKLVCFHGIPRPRDVGWLEKGAKV